MVGFTKKIFLLTLVSGLCFLFFIHSDCLAQKFHLFEKALKKDSTQKYFVRIPNSYSSDRRYPLFIAIHWYTGTARQQVEEWEFWANKEGHILLCPQFSDGYQWLNGKQDEKLIEIIREAEEEFSINRDKIFLVGFSGGAQFVHRFAFKHPKYVKAACVLAGGDYSNPPYPAVTKIKFYVAVGEKDERYQRTRDFYNQLIRSGYKATFKSFPLVGHILHSNIKRGVVDFLNALEN